MCYSNTITWIRCGHFTIKKDFCDEALRRDPPSLCIVCSFIALRISNAVALLLTISQEAHAPIFTDVPASDGVCPDVGKHPRGPGKAAMSAWGMSLGIERTSGPGNAWYRNDQGQT